jgi:hypothetical protein
MNPAPNRALRQQAWWLENAAHEYTAFQAFCHEQQAYARQGITPPQADDPGVRIHRSGISDPTGDHATHAWWWQTQLDDAADLAQGIAISIRAFRHHMATIMRHASSPPSQPVCGEGGHDKDGAIEWHDPDCQRLAVRHGLCDMHRMRWVRWKRDHNLNTDHMYQTG